MHSSQSNKNIPISADTVMVSRWNSFALNQPKEKTPAIAVKVVEKPKHTIRWSVSPLTKFAKSPKEEDSAPNGNYGDSIGSTDNRFGDLNRLVSSGKSSDSLKHFPNSKKRNSVDESMEDIFRQPSTSLEDEAAIRQEIGQDGLSLSDEETTMDAEAPSSVLDFMKDTFDPLQRQIIPELLPKKHNISNRTQQKMLDLKNLMSDEGSDVNLSPNSNLLDYATKIQNEAILAEWGQIRHRFSSDISGPVQKSITCQAGVLGSIRRCRDHGYYKKESHNPIQPDEKELYLRKFWNGESLDSKEITPSPATMNTHTRGEATH
ncbi:hypothetical protein METBISCDRAFT_21064 [Metschnikowia bicuspidata]|uniref:Uncharacterized protein n=1 Tax=Metschnikowia bicuspidata TaxID=27322 RepID=A0A4P9ZHZ2_9ASCO|nr:hypothetical protein METBISCDRAFT_21064 [Metschnikowia bicuspidata]